MFLIAVLARCVPQDLDNQFISLAISATFIAAMLALVATFYWFLPRYRRIRSHSGFAWLSYGLAGLITLVDISIGGVAVWIWLQAHSFIPWCSPRSDAALDAQHQRLDTAIFACLLVYIVSFCLFVGSGLAAAVVAIIRVVTRTQATRSI